MSARKLATLTLLLLMACGRSHSELSSEQLRNASYPLLGSEPVAWVSLVNGEFVDEEARTRAILGENWIARGDLSGDGKRDVAVVLYFDTGGSGNFREFLVLRSRNGASKLLGGIFAGDRIRIESFVIVDGALVVEMLTHADDDPICCPTLRVRDRFLLRDGALVLVERKELERIEP